MAGLANHLLPAAPEIVPLPLHAVVYAPRVPSARVLISPATTNQNLEFQGDSDRFFQTTSLGGEFLQHPAFGAVFKTQRPDDYWHVPDEAEGKLPGRIVALSYDSTTAEVEGKGLEVTSKKTGAERRDFALKSAPKGLVSTIMTAYNQHCNLVISPDEVWLAILAQFCTYLNRNAEELRSRIVAHEGQIELRAYGPGTLETADYQSMIRDLLGEIRKNIKSPELADWFRPGFSTTTERDEVCAAATAMSSLQAYFSYECVLTCGIPSVTLMGTVADWKLLREKIDRLLEFEVKNNPEGNVMKIWVGYLRKVSDGLIESAEHPSSAKTLEFWDKVSRIKRCTFTIMFCTK